MKNNKKKGFTLVELLVVIGIIAILAAVVAPNAFKAVEKSKIATAEADTKAIGTAYSSYHIDTTKYITDATKANLVTDPGSAVPGWNGPYIERIKDKNPWGGNYTIKDVVAVGAVAAVATPFAAGEENRSYIEITSVSTEAKEKIESDLDGTAAVGAGTTGTTGSVRWIADGGGTTFTVSIFLSK